MINFSSQRPKYFPFVAIAISLSFFIVILLLEFSQFDHELIDFLAIKTKGYFIKTIDQPTESARLVMSLFLHGNWLHWLVNTALFVLLAFSIEHIIGHKKFLLIFLLTGIVGNVFACIALQNNDNLLMGSSGAVSGLIGLWLVLFPNKKINFILPIGLYLQKASMPISIIILMWLFVQLILQFQPNSIYDIAWASHIMGFTTGFFIGWFVK